MPRQNVLFNEKGFRELAKRYAALAAELEAVAEKMRAAKMTCHVSMAHTAMIHQGLVSSRKFVRQAHSKLDAYLFQPREARIWTDEQHRTRCRPDRRSQAGNGKGWSSRKPGARYGTRSYQQAVKRACRRAGIPPFHPHQLRHTIGTEVRREHGAELARVLLGHSRLSTTEIYAERDLLAAAKVVLQRGCHQLTN